MRTEIELPKDDSCILCTNECPKDIYECPTLNDAILKKTARYKWCWMSKNGKN